YAVEVAETETRVRCMARCSSRLVLALDDQHVPDAEPAELDRRREARGPAADHEGVHVQGAHPSSTPGGVTALACRMGTRSSKKAWSLAPRAGRRRAVGGPRVRPPCRAFHDRDGRRESAEG